MYILGISAYYHDSAACLLKNGVIVAAVQEERFTRIKNDAAFPEKSIRYCLDLAGISLCDVNHVAYYEKPFLKFERLLETYLAFAPIGLGSFLKSMPMWLKEKLFFKKMVVKTLQKIDARWNFNGTNLLFTTHHNAHAASAFYPSPFNEAMILTVDGVGEWATTSISKGSRNTIDNISYINFPHSLGLLYSAFTYYLGFKVNCDEYKVMGLAPYGKPVFVDIILKELIDIKPDGSYRLNMRYFTYATALTMTGEKFSHLFGEPVRSKEGALTAFHMDMASSIQQVTEEVMILLTSSLHRKYGGENLCLAGGVALNCVANGKVLKQSGFKNIWIQPAAGDAGGALGAAFATHYDYLKQERVVVSGADSMQNALLGPEYSDAEIRKVLRFYKLQFKRLDRAELYTAIASEIVAGKVIGYFKGRMEYGPRALGARSIIADPRNSDMQSVLNLKIKYRESFRPFAPSVLEEYADEYFDIGAASPYMLLVAKLLPKQPVTAVQNYDSQTIIKRIYRARSVIPAVTHIDNTARIQTVNKNQNPDLYELISAFYKLTGCPMVINTSFNRMDEPIVCTPEDAVLCFIQTGIDVLAIENYIVFKSQ